MKITTWNVNSINARLPRVISFIQRWKPDYLLLQELKCTEEKYPLKELTDLGYTSFIHGQKTYNGVAILTKTNGHYKLQKGFENPIRSDLNTQSRLTSIFIEDIKTWIYSAYIPNGKEVGSESYHYKLEWLAALYEELKSKLSLSCNVLIGGDFNIAPKDLDVHDPKEWHEKILCSTKEREIYEKILSLGFQDAFRLHSNFQEFSWWDYRSLGFPLNKGLRIDHILISEKLAKSCTHCFIERDERKGEKASDHAPVICELDV